MCTYTITGKHGNSKILTGSFSESRKNGLIPENAWYITDDIVFDIYKEYFPSEQTIIIPAGEDNKNLEMLEYITRKLIEAGADRKSFLIGFGGGVVTDITGFVAATYMRGIRFSFIPTTLLAMIDAAIGGKNGVNIGKYKNITGTFCQPEFVLIDPDFLNSLPDEEYINGMAEALKHMLISDYPGFERYLNDIERILDRDRDLLGDFICRQAKIKIDIVNNDERESGERKKLNFGHTFGHPIEKICGIKHGFAVATGMVIAAEISKKYGLLSDSDVEIIKHAIRKTGLAIKKDFDKKAVTDLMIKDKKKDGNLIDFIMLRGLGTAEIVPVNIHLLIEIFNSIELTE
jgi:3-dehydroquinate synthase